MLTRSVKRIIEISIKYGLKAVLILVPYGTERWQWVRGFVTYVPGEIGVFSRRWFYNFYLKRGSDDLYILPGAIIENPGSVALGDHVTLARDAWLNGACDIQVGNYAGIGPGVIIHTANHNYTNPEIPFKEQGHTFKPVLVGEDVWLAARVVVLPGTVIGRGAIIAAGAVISGNIEPMAILAGVPARKIGRREVVNEKGEGE
jgi:acetyltransferase-like isoleucine patch superfamily enzyme